MTSNSLPLGPGTRATTAIRGLLVAVSVLVFVVAARQVVTNFSVGVDLLIPLHAAERWMSGATVYVADAFTDPTVTSPFLYPPFVLPFVAPLTALPQLPVLIAWSSLQAAVAVAICRRLAIPWPVVPFVLLWEPMFGSIWGGNVQVLLFAAYVVTFWQRPRRHDLVPEPRDLDAPDACSPRIGWYAATVASLKASQVHAWLAIGRRSPRAALVGALPWVVVVVATLPIVGVGLYLDWLGQVSQATDPNWRAIGPSLFKYLPASVVAILTVASLVAAVAVRGTTTGAWIGLLMLLVAPNMHDFTGLFLLPSMLLIRRELALLAAILTSTFTAEGWWLGIAIVVGAMLAGMRWPAAREPSAADGYMPAGDPRPAPSDSP